MSNLSSLLNQDGEIRVAESVEFESISESQMSQIMQAALEDVAIEDMQEMVTENEDVLTEGALPEDMVVLEKTIVKMDNKAKKQKAYKLAILQCAKDDDNRDYKKLETLWKMQKYLMRRLEKKYSSRAKSRMKQTAKKTPNSAIGGKVSSKLGGKKLTRSQRETQKALAGNNKVPSKVKSQFNSISSKLGGKI